MLTRYEVTRLLASPVFPAFDARVRHDVRGLARRSPARRPEVLDVGARTSPFTVGLPVLIVWALSAGGLLTVQYLAPLLVAGAPLGSTLQTGFGAVAALTYVIAQAVKPKAQLVAAAPRRVRPEQEA